LYHRETDKGESDGIVKLTTGSVRVWTEDPQDLDSDCDKMVKGGVLRESSRFRSVECKCPAGLVVSGESEVCQQKWNTYDRYFDLDDSHLKALPEGSCECKHRPGCGMVRYSTDLVLPKNAAKAGLPPPVIVGTRDNINTGVKELDEEFYGIWWMKHNAVPEELASMAGAFSRLTGAGPNGGNVPVGEVDWNLTVRVPNAEHNHWSWPDTWTARNVIMKMYTSPGQTANNFTMYDTTHGEIETGLKNFPGIWVEAWYLEKLNPDTWLRTTSWQRGSLFSPLGDSYYTLTRIVKEDGEPTKYLQEFKDYMAKNQSGADLLVWDSDDPCKRSCMLAGKSCHYCHDCCTGESSCWYKR
jgi:hypothetical protein